MSDISDVSTGLVAFEGIESGLDTSSIISAYMAADEGPLNLLEAEQTTNEDKISAYQTIESQLESLQTAAEAVSSPNAFESDVTANSSNSSVATATVGTGATTGSTTFSVDQLATADTLVSSGTVSATTDVVASGDLLLSSGAGGLGLSTLSGSGLSSGSHTIDVTQASAGATAVGSTAPSTATTITSANDQLAVTIDGTAQTYTLATGTYTASQLATEIGTASGGTLTGEINSSGLLQVSTVEQGSNATLAIGSGSANSALGLTEGSGGSGSDGIITVDGTANTISDIAADGTTSVTLDSGTGGTITATLAAGGLTAGSSTAENVSVGNGSLASVVSAINGAGAGVTAQALQVGTNQYALEVTSDSTGSNNDVAMDTSAFSSSGLGTLETTTAGQDAIVSLGGSGGYQVSSSSNTFSGLLPGVSVSVDSVSSAPVTISVTPDGTAAATAVQSLVTAANTVLSTISTDTAYDETTNTAGVLNGDYSLQSLAQSILSTFSQAIGTSSALTDTGSTGSTAGLSLDGTTGQINFDATTFASDFDSDPSAVAAMFSQSGTFAAASGSGASNSDVTLAYAGASTEPGSYAVVIDQSASQATDTGTASFSSAASTVDAAETYTISSGGSSVDYGVTSGETLADVASGLNAAFAANGLLYSAQVVTDNGSSSLQITSADYGSSQSMTVSASGSDELGLSGTFTGTDVEGTIDGVTATGDGQVLNAPVDDTTLDGMSLVVTTPGITSATSLGTFTYTAGLAGGLNSLASTSTATDGEIPTTVTGLQNTDTSLASQITLEQQLLAQQQDALTKEFDNLETTLSSLKSESSYLDALDGDSSSSSSSSSLSSSESSS